MESEAPSPKEETSLDVMYDIALQKLNAQLAAVDSLDNKIALTFTLASALVVAVLGSASLMVKPIHWNVVLLASLSAMAFVLALIPLYQAYRTARWDFGPELNTLRKHCTDPVYASRPIIIKEWVADECIRAYNANKKPLVDKSSALSVALGAVSIQAVLLGLMAIFWLVT